MNFLSRLSHVALTVSDPSRTASLLAGLFGASAIQRADDDEHDETYMRLGDTWFVFVKADVTRPPTGDHVAFLVSPATLAAVAEKLAAIGHAHQLARSGTALYFSDFDNHMFELDTIGVEAQLRE
ncbi:MAG TPA: VOC family protein [Rhodanobacteraceae bacterium]|nr:VOC family protein [Rhodanobacteraceae bacterium]